MRTCLIVALLATGIAARAELELAPTPDHPIRPDVSVAWCPTLQLAWQHVSQTHPEWLPEAPPGSLAARLLAPPVSPDILPRQAWIIHTGRTGPEFVAALRRRLDRAFGHNAPEVPAALADDDSGEPAVYCCLLRHLPFPRPFISTPGDHLQFHTANGTTPVRCWGTGPNDITHYLEELAVVRWTGPDDFILRFDTTARPTEYILLAKIPPPATLQAGIDTIAAACATTAPEDPASPRNPLDEEILAVPVVHFNQETFLPLVKTTSYRIGFHLDEYGADVSSATVIIFGGGTRRFVFDKPFMVALWRQGAPMPYLAIWVATPDILVPYHAEER